MGKRGRGAGRQIRADFFFDEREVGWIEQAELVAGATVVYSAYRGSGHFELCERLQARGQATVVLPLDDDILELDIEDVQAQLRSDLEEAFRVRSVRPTNDARDPRVSRVLRLLGRIGSSTGVPVPGEVFEWRRQRDIRRGALTEFLSAVDERLPLLPDAGRADCAADVRALQARLSTAGKKP